MTYVPISNAQFELLAAIVDLEQSGSVRSLFHVASSCLMEYHNGHRMLYALECVGVVAVRRNGPGYPLAIRSTDLGRRIVAERLAATAAGKKVN